MPINMEDRYSKVISVHDEPRPVLVSLPNMVPGNFFIPGVSAHESYFERCIITMGPNKSLRYATRKTAFGKPYVELKIPDGKTFQVSTEQQTHDEYGAKLVPDVMRVAVPVFSAQIANEIERQLTNTEDDGSAWGYGVVAIRGDEPTEAELRLATERQIARLRNMVAETNRWAKVSTRNISPAARYAAQYLHKEGLIVELPDWAISIEQLTRRCPACNVVYAGLPVKCGSCGAILDWHKAVDFGLVRPEDVPQQHREAAGVAAE